MGEIRNPYGSEGWQGVEMLSEPWRKEELAVIKQQMLEAQAAKKK